MSKRSMCRATLAIAAAVAMVATSALAAEPGKKTAKAEAKPDPAQQAMMAEMMRLAAPGTPHEKLKPTEGKWKAVQKSWFAPGEPKVTEGTCENHLILGGRFLEQRYRSVDNGQFYEGYGLTGYDNKKNTYNMVWIDNLSTAMMTGEGAIEAGSGDLTMKSTGDGPDGKPTELRMVTHIVDGSRYVFSMYATMEGKEQLMMEITYTRL